MFKQTAIIIGFVSCSTGTFAQMNESWKEMVIKVATLDEWGVYKINRQLQCLEGLHFSGYYKPASCLLLKYDPRKILDPAIVPVVVYRLNQKLKNKILEDITIYEVIDGKIDPAPPSKSPKKPVKK